MPPAPDQPQQPFDPGVQPQTPSGPDPMQAFGDPTATPQPDVAAPAAQPVSDYAQPAPTDFAVPADQVAAAPVVAPQPIAPEPFAQPVVSEPVQPAQPVQPLPVAEPVPPAGPAPQPGAPVPAPAVTDPTQPGYVPPTSPSAMPAMMGTPGVKAPGGKTKLIRTVIMIVVALVVLSGGGLLIKDTLFTGSKISKSDLVDDTAEGVSFKRPKNWTKVDKGSHDGATYTEGGKAIDNTDQAILVNGQSFGGNYDELSDSQKTSVIDSMKESFSEADGFERESCKETTSPVVTRIQQPNYTDALQIEATCHNFANRNVSAKIKAVFALKGNNANMVTIVAVDKTWDKSGDTFDEILMTFKPAQ